MSHQLHRILETPDVRAGGQIGQMPGLELHREDLDAAEGNEEDRHRVADEGEGGDQVVGEGVLLDRRHQIPAGERR